MGNRLNTVEVIKLDTSYTQAECQAFIEKWNSDNPDKYNDASFMPLFSPFIDRCELIKNEEMDVLSVVMLVRPDNWPTKQEAADISFFITSLKNDYENLEVKMMFEVVWDD